MAFAARAKTGVGVRDIRGNPETAFDGVHGDFRDATPYVSVVLPVRNEALFIRPVLDCLLAQEYPVDAFEIIVADGQSTDGTWDIVQEYVGRTPQVRLLTNPRRVSSAARNLGINHARGDVVLFIDGHCELNDRQYLRHLANAFASSGADCVGRPQPLDVTGATGLQRAIAAARKSWLGHHPASFIYCTERQMVPAKSVAVAYRRDVFERVGRFDESFQACEDVELNHRVDQAGLRCLLEPSIAVCYYPRDSHCGLFRQLVHYGRGRVRLMRKHPTTLSIGSFLPAAFLLGVLVGLPLCFLSTWLAAGYLGTLALYLAVVLLNSAMLSIRSRRPSFLWRLPVVFVSIHVACGWGVWCELLRGGLRLLWRAETPRQVSASRIPTAERPCGEPSKLTS